MLMLMTNKVQCKSKQAQTGIFCTFNGGGSKPNHYCHLLIENHYSEKIKNFNQKMVAQRKFDPEIHPSNCEPNDSSQKHPKFP
ncbi:hypothetical protein DERP_006040 [Dermatophagoides pteronyssinus]|uniref:Uncharacterized protein n=1 Tax=Dermatophagoides pteronyssinus TaxID=6956 RepID=A0ABQ8JSB3_DERPT|nr:hypothetical protein DERP_006040 [Dermatophagoides pteronyssinus]